MALALNEFQKCTCAPGGPRGLDGPSSWPKRSSQMIQAPMPPLTQEPLQKPLGMASRQGNPSRKETELPGASQLIRVPTRAYKPHGTTQASSPILPLSHSGTGHTDLFAVPKTPQAFSGFKDFGAFLSTLMPLPSDICMAPSLLQISA